VVKIKEILYGQKKNIIPGKLRVTKLSKRFSGSNPVLVYLNLVQQSERRMKDG